MSSVILSVPELSSILFYQFALVGLGFIGAGAGYYLMRTVEDDEWRETGMRFVRALALFSSLEFAELTDQFWSYNIIAVLVEIAVISYIVYGVAKLRLLIEDM
jgi:hypothetical protein